MNDKTITKLVERLAIARIEGTEGCERAKHQIITEIEDIESVKHPKIQEFSFQKTTEFLFNLIWMPNRLFYCFECRSTWSWADLGICT